MAHYYNPKVKLTMQGRSSVRPELSATTQVLSLGPHLMVCDVCSDNYAQWDGDVDCVLGEILGHDLRSIDGVGCIVATLSDHDSDLWAAKIGSCCIVARENGTLPEW